MKRDYHKILVLTVIGIVLLAVLFRLPPVPHELGSDSYFIHELADSIVECGSAVWILSPLSFFGFFPMSYASGIPFFLSIVSTLTGVDMETTILLVPIGLGLFGAISAYLLSYKINQDRLLSLLTMLFFAVGPLSVKYTSWTVSTRGGLLMFTPLLLLSFLNATEKKRWYCGIFSVFLIVSLSIHKMAILFFVFLVVFFIAKVCSKYLSTPIRPWLQGFILTSLLALFFIIPFFFFQHTWTLLFFNIFGVASWYNSAIGVLLTMGARLGILLVLSFIGFIYLSTKKEKNFYEWFIIISSLSFTILLSYAMYAYEYMLIIFCLLSAYGTIGILKFVADSRFIPKLISYNRIVVVILLLLLFCTLLTVTIRYSNDSGNYLSEPEFALSKYLQAKFSDVSLEGQVKGQLSTSTRAEGSSILGIESNGDIKYSIALKNLPKTIPEAYSFLKEPYNLVTTCNNSNYMGEDVAVRLYDIKTITQNYDILYTNSRIQLSLD